MPRCEGYSFGRVGWSWGRDFGVGSGLLGWNGDFGDRARRVRKTGVMGRMGSQHLRVRKGEFNVVA